jgi:rare lipoprotein A
LGENYKLGEKHMQTKRVLLLLASLLWTSTMFAATHKTKAQKLTPVVRYTGLASWYGKERQGHKMANGERFDRHALTAACWFLPLGSQVRIINLTNGKEVEVTITDRGPATWLKPRRIIDLSEEAANQLGYWMAGTAPVFLQPVLHFETESTNLNADLVIESRIE